MHPSKDVGLGLSIYIRSRSIGKAGGRERERERGRKTETERERERGRDKINLAPHAHVQCRGKNYEDHCRKSQVDMDDILPGVIIDAVLGIDINETAVLKGQLDDIMYFTSNNPEELKRVKREVHGDGAGRFIMNQSMYIKWGM